MSTEYCIGVPNHWTELLSAHHEYASGVHRASVSRAQAAKRATA
jgi:hypothetical protein